MEVQAALHPRMRMKLYTRIAIGLVAGAVLGIGVNIIAARTGSSTGVDIVRSC